MTTGAPFQPTPFGTTVVAPETNQLGRQIPYISPSEYRFAPTAVGTKSLVAGSTNQTQDSLASLSQVIARASSWADLFCFHKADGTMAASQTTESDWVKAKPDGSLSLICNFKPVLEVTGMGVGPTPSQITNINSNTSSDIWIQGKIINVPTVCYNGIPTTTFPVPLGSGGKAYVIWNYINGFPHTMLTANATAGQSFINVLPTNGSLVAGVYKNTQLLIVDGAQSERITVSSTPTANVLALASPLQYNHTLPLTPDFIRVTAIPNSFEQAIISLTNCLIKLRGSRAQVMGGLPGTPPGKQALAEAGALEDYEIAADLLDPFVTVYMH